MNISALQSSKCRATTVRPCICCAPGKRLEPEILIADGGSGLILYFQLSAPPLRKSYSLSVFLRAQFSLFSLFLLHLFLFSWLSNHCHLESGTGIKLWRLSETSDEVEWRIDWRRMQIKTILAIAPDKPCLEVEILVTTLASVNPNLTSPCSGYAIRDN